MKEKKPPRNVEKERTVIVFGKKGIDKWLDAIIVDLI